MNQLLTTSINRLVKTYKDPRFTSTYTDRKVTIELCNTIYYECKKITSEAWLESDSNVEIFVSSFEKRVKELKSEGIYILHNLNLSYTIQNFIDEQIYNVLAGIFNKRASDKNVDEKQYKKEYYEFVCNAQSQEGNKLIRECYKDLERVFEYENNITIVAIKTLYDICASCEKRYLGTEQYYEHLKATVDAVFYMYENIYNTAKWYVRKMSDEMLYDLGLKIFSGDDREIDVSEIYWDKGNKLLNDITQILIKHNYTLKDSILAIILDHFNHRYKFSLTSIKLRTTNIEDNELAVYYRSLESHVWTLQTKDTIIAIKKHIDEQIETNPEFVEKAKKVVSNLDSITPGTVILQDEKFLNITDYTWLFYIVVLVEALLSSKQILTYSMEDILELDKRIFRKHYMES